MPANSSCQLPVRLIKIFRGFIWILVVSGLAGLALGLTAEENSPSKSDPASLVLTDLRLDPPSPGPDTLCKLWVTIRNDTDQVASLLHFRVRMNDQEVGRYASDSFVVRLDPATSQEIQLFNVWSSETGRPPTANGRLELEVVLEAATWVQVEASSDGGPETWTPGESVPGLPSRFYRVVTKGRGEAQ